MYEELKTRMSGEFTARQTVELEAMEALFHWQNFTPETARQLGNCIVEEGRRLEGEMVVQIFTVQDRLVLFQYVGRGLGARNLDFAAQKAETVLVTGHCSLWALVQELTGKPQDSVFRQSNCCMPVGGAFPIYSAGKLTAVVTTSGLHEGRDHLAVVRAAAALKNEAVPAFHGVYI